MMGFFRGLYHQLCAAVGKRRLQREYEELVNILRTTVPLGIPELERMEEVLGRVVRDRTALAARFRMLRMALRQRRQLGAGARARYSMFIAREHERLAKRRIDRDRDVSYGVNGRIVYGDVDSEEERAYFTEENVRALNSLPFRKKQCAFDCESTQCRSCIEARLRREMSRKMQQDEEMRREERAKKRRLENDGKVVTVLNERLGCPLMVARSLADDAFTLDELDSEDREEFLRWKESNRQLARQMNREMFKGVGAQGSVFADDADARKGRGALAETPPSRTPEEVEPVRDVPVRDVPVRDVPVRDVPVRDVPARDVPDVPDVPRAKASVDVQPASPFVAPPASILDGPGCTEPMPALRNPFSKGAVVLPPPVGGLGTAPPAAEADAPEAARRPPRFSFENPFQSGAASKPQPSAPLQTDALVEPPVPAEPPRGPADAPLEINATATSPLSSIIANSPLGQQAGALGAFGGAKPDVSANLTASTGEQIMPAALSNPFASLGSYGAVPFAPQPQPQPAPATASPLGIGSAVAPAGPGLSNPFATAAQPGAGMHNPFASLGLSSANPFQKRLSTDDGVAVPSVFGNAEEGAEIRSRRARRKRD